MKFCVNLGKRWVGLKVFLQLQVLKSTNFPSVLIVISLLTLGFLIIFLRKSPCLLSLLPIIHCYYTGVLFQLAVRCVRGGYSIIIRKNLSIFMRLHKCFSGDIISCLISDASFISWLQCSQCISFKFFPIVTMFSPMFFKNVCKMLFT